MEHILETALEIPLPVERVFAFFAEASNLERITPRELHFRIVTPLPIDLGPGTLIQYRLRLFGIPFGWTTRISHWDPPRQFVDEQLRGPYALWEHTHTITATESGALVQDRVRYRLPLWPLGELAAPLVRRQLVRIFSYREKAVLAALLGQR